MIGGTVPPREPEKIFVRIDVALQDLIPQFLANRRRDIETLQQALAESNFTVAQTLGHRLKGDGGGYGFEGISEIGSLLEAAAARQDHAGIERQVVKLADYLTRLDITFVQ